MAQPRVHEFAKEVGVPSKEVIAKLKDMGEFVKSSSSTLNPMVLKKLRAEFPAAAAKPAAKAAPAESAAKPAAKPAPKPAAAKPAAKPAAAPKPAAAKPAAKPAPKPAAKPVAAESAAPKPAAAKPAAKPAAAPKPGGPRPGNNPFASQQGMARPEAAPKPAAPKPAAPKPGPKPGPRPGNNPFASQQGMKRGGGDSQRSGGPRPARNGRPGGNGGARPGGNGGPRPAGGARPGGNGGPRPAAGARPGAPRPAGGGGARPNPSMMPKVSNVGGGASGSNNGGGNGGGGARRGGGSGGGFNRGPGRPGPGGRGNAQGAFGRGGSKRKGRKSKAARRHEQEQLNAPAPGGVVVPRGDGSTEIRLRRGASIMDFAEKIGANPASLITVLFHLGEMATQTQSLDEETFELLGAELGYVIKIVSPEDEERELLESFDIDLEAEELDDAENMVPRPPVVTVMGHVDHGKTKLLDAIRHTDVVDTEHGGITQHIGAYQVTVKAEDGTARPITFIDTPGHEAFTAMRARGAQVTDIAILVVAADDGVMPQTVEAINHAQAAGVPIVVAVNKVDKDTANPEKIRSQLTEYGLVAEEYGGDVMFVNISAKQRQGIRELLEAVLLTADAALTLEANPNTDARGVAIEANLDKGRGAVATMLVQRGTLHVGDSLVVGSSYGRVRAMFDDAGNDVSEAGPSMPVAVLGLTSVPRAGDSFLVASDDRTARQIADKREAAERQALLAKRRKRVSLEDFDKVLAEGEVDTLNLVIKGDVSGAVEALEDSLLRIDVGDEVALRIIHRGVGAITQNDVNLATVDNAVIIGFNVRPAERVAEMADAEGVEIKYYNVIYSAIDDIEAALKGMLKPIYEEVQLGTAEIRQVFRSGKFGNIAGSIVRSGTIKRGTKARLVRDGVVVADNLEIASLRREKDDVTEVREGYECGITLGYKDITEGDVIETWEMREKARD